MAVVLEVILGIIFYKLLDSSLDNLIRYKKIDEDKIEQHNQMTRERDRIPLY